MLYQLSLRNFSSCRIYMDRCQNAMVSSSSPVHKQVVSTVIGCHFMGLYCIDDLQGTNIARCMKPSHRGYHAMVVPCHCGTMLWRWPATPPQLYSCRAHPRPDTVSRYLTRFSGIFLFHLPSSTPSCLVTPDTTTGPVERCTW